MESRKSTLLAEIEQKKAILAEKVKKAANEKTENVPVLAFMEDIMGMRVVSVEGIS